MQPYPQNQQYAPMGPAAVPPQQWNGQGYHQTPPAQYAPQQAQPYVMPTLNDAGVGRGDGSPFVQVRNLLGRVVAMQALTHDPNNKYEEAIRPAATVNLIVFDGGPIQYGDLKAGNGRASRGVVAQVSQLPAEFDNVRITNGSVVREIAPYVPTQGWVFGVLREGTEGTKGNPPILLDPIPAEHPVRAHLDQAFAARHHDPKALKRVVEPINGGWEAPAAGAPGGYPMAAPPAQAPPLPLPPQVNYGQAPMAAQLPPRPGPDGAWYAAPVGWTPEQWGQLPDALISQFGQRVG